jgi:hypothetical protein
MQNAVSEGGEAHLVNAFRVLLAHGVGLELLVGAFPNPRVNLTKRQLFYN